jgi:hypothetical protein
VGNIPEEAESDCQVQEDTVGSARAKSMAGKMDSGISESPSTGWGKEGQVIFR